MAAYFWSERSPAYSTPIGGLASVPIPDGSEITLNTNSEVRVHVSDAERRIDLKQGEAFFNVAKDPTRPFVVQAGNTRVIALGTRFSVWRNGKDVRVVVSEGRVRLENRDNRDADTASSALTAGTVARTRDAKVAVQKRSVAEVEELLSWRSGLVVFKETPLAQAAMELNRYNTRKLIVEDEAIAGFRIGGTFRATNLDAFVRLLKQGFAIDAEEQEGRIVLTEKL
ncbi:MAG: FecR domain-containing protein [Steroidobacter sp.]|nr:FecR domain-containing protein [Steroidobacter sp.]